MLKQLTEKQMGDAFEELLKSNGVKEFPSFESIFREIVCAQGIPDFITVSGIVTNSFINITDASMNTCCLILSLLKPRSPRTKEYLINSTGLTDNTIQRALKELELNKFVHYTDKHSYILGENWAIPKAELWAFELKLEDWKHAIFQAMQYKAFAHRVIIVLPHTKEKVVDKNIDVFKNLGIGVVLFNISTRSYVIKQRPIKNIPASKRHNFFALGKLAAESQNIML